MFRRYRYAVLTAFAWLPLSAASPNISPHRSVQQREQQSAAASLIRVANALEVINSPKRKALNCSAGSEDYQSDLCAQWKSANAAAQAARAADQTVTIGWVSVMLAGITMAAAIAAAVFAWRAAKHAQASVAGFRAVEEPRLKLHIAEIETIPDAKRITLSVSNIGRSDAIISFFAWGFAPGDVPLDYLVGPSRVERVKGSGEIELGYVKSRLPMQDGETLVALIKYETVFGESVERRRWFIQNGHAAERQIDITVL